jgi:hypothetical protein
VIVDRHRVLLHPQGMAPRIINLDEWAWHVIDRLRQEVRNYLGFAVPLRLRSGDGELRLLTTLAHFGTAVDVTVAELRLEAFLPADEPTAAALQALDQRPLHVADRQRRSKGTPDQVPQLSRHPMIRLGDASWSGGLA